MPGVIAVSDFVRETREDINSPTTSSFVNKIPECKETVGKLEEVRIEFFKIYLMKKCFDLVKFENFV